MVTHAFAVSSHSSQEQHLPWLSHTSPGHEAAELPAKTYTKTHSFLVVGRIYRWYVRFLLLAYVARSDGIVAIHEYGHSPAGLYIRFIGPEEDVVSAEPGIRSGRSACLNWLIIPSGYIYGPKKRQSLNLHFH